MRSVGHDRRRAAGATPVSDSPRPAAPLMHQHAARARSPVSAMTRVTIATSTDVGKLGEPLDCGGSVRCSSMNARARRLSARSSAVVLGRTDSAHDRRGLLAEQLTEIRCGDDRLQAAVGGGVACDRQRTDVRRPPSRARRRRLRCRGQRWSAVPPRCARPADRRHPSPSAIQ